MTISTLEHKYYVGDVGTLIYVSTLNDLTTATTTDLLVQKPRGAVVTWDADVDPTDDTRILYEVKVGDFDQAGEYKLQAYVVFPTGQWRGNTAKFTVLEAFK
jgi:hypothetical protein